MMGKRLLIWVYKQVKTLFIRYRTEIIYLIVGGLTTLVNFAVYFFAKDLLHIHYVAANVIAWVFAVIFAFFANRVWVFRSTNRNILKESVFFVLSRLFSLLLETGLLYAAVDTLRFNYSISKVAVAIVVVIVNYITGRMVVFKK